MNTVDINCDMGESFGNYKCGLDSEIISYISSANIACGFHASDPLVMSESVKLAKKYGVSVGAHPGFPDLVGFGRRNMNVSDKDYKVEKHQKVAQLVINKIEHFDIVEVSEMAQTSRGDGAFGSTGLRNNIK